MPTPRALPSFDLPRLVALSSLVSLLACGGGGDGGGTTAPDLTPRVTGVSVGPSSPSISVGDSLQLSANVTAQNGASQAVSWSSSNSAVASVSTSGVVRGVAAGTATITAKSAFDASKSGSVAVVVSAPGTVPAFATVNAPPGTSFEPQKVDIAAGGTVTWVFGSTTHNVTFNAGGPGNIGNTANSSVSRTFTAVGTYNYNCTLHPGMTGSVVVH